MAEDAKKPGLSEVAELCGVSRMTVSRVLRDDPKVSEATRQMVLQAASRLNYFPPAYGDAAGDKKRYYVLFRKDFSFKDPFFSEIILSVQQELFSRNCECSFGIIGDEYEEFLKYYNMLKSGDSRGILVVGDVPNEHISALLERFINLVLIDNPGGPGISRPYNSVYCDNAHGSYLAVKHLLDLGRRRVLLIHGNEGHYFTEDMLSGYRRALGEYGLGFDPGLTVAADFHIDGGCAATIQALDRGLSFDAVFSNDEMACGAIRALQERAFKVPEDVSVVGFDGLALGEAVNPPLTTVTVDRSRMGRMAVKRLLELEDGSVGDEAFTRVGIFPELVIRHSSGGSP
ncbi:MAG: LacI family DNA-binding transcriptional regulator [bacterium]|nr:LacI family DNA-binding transcriptional regulator [bacterium]